MSVAKNKITKWLLILIGGLGLFYFGFGIFLGMTSADTIDYSQKMLNNFKSTASFINSFKTAKHRLPNQAEIQAQFGNDHNVFISPLQDIDQPAFIKAKPADSYVLYIWRGEWPEYFAGWSQQTTITLNKNDYFPFHSPILAIFAAISSATIFVIGFRLRIS